jgi:hypothetical protein
MHTAQPPPDAGGLRGEETRDKKQETRRLGSARIARSNLRAESGLLQRSGLVSPVSERSEGGRWISRDLIGERGGVNLYEFCGNDGDGNVDVPSGDCIGQDRPSATQLL